MNRVLAFLLALCGSLLVFEFGRAQEPSASKPIPTIVVPVGPHDPVAVVETLKAVFASEAEIAFSAVPSQSMLIVRCPQERHDEVMHTIQSLTPAIEPIWINVLHLRAAHDFSAQERARLNGPLSQVVQAVKELRASGRLFVVHDVEMTVLPGIQSRMQIGGQVATRTGSMRMQMGGNREVAQYQWSQVGTLVTLRATSDHGQVALELSFESSSQRDQSPAVAQTSVEHGQAPADDAGSDAPAGIGTLSLELSIRIANGQARLVSGMSSSDSADSTSHNLMVVAAEVLPQK